MMKKRILMLLFLLAGMCLSAAATGFTARRIGGVPSLDNGGGVHPGYAGAFIGKSGDRILVAGGSNFTQGMPWEGGAKQYSDRIYMIVRQSDGYECREVESRLPVALAHGCSASDGNALYCFGGQNGDGVSEVVYRLTASGDDVAVDSLTVVPRGVVSKGAVFYQGKIYVTGVKGDENVLFRYDAGTNTVTGLTACPGDSRTSAVFAGQHNGNEYVLYLIGGRHEKDGRIELCSDVWEYSLLRDEWKPKAEIRIDGESRCLMASPVVPYGSAHLLLFGGDDGVELMERVGLQRAIAAAATQEEKAELEEQLAARFRQHRGFSSQVYAYHAITDTWSVLGEWNEDFAVESTAVLFDGKVVIPMGEVHPGVRTSSLTEVGFVEEVNFGWGNYLVIFIYIAAMMGVGFIFVRRNNNTEQFFKGGGKIPWWAAGISIFATALSAITFLSIPAKAYSSNWGMFMFNVAILLIVPIVIRFYLPFFRNLKVASAYQYLEQRFDRSVKYLASFFFCAFMFARIAVVLFLPSLALHAVTGIDIYFCILIMGLVTIAYCTMGGIEAVVWGDVIQGTILVGGALVSLVYLLMGIDGGLAGMVEVAVEDAKFNIFNFDADWTQPVFFVTLLGGVANQLLTYTSDQSVIQRYITVKDIEGTKKGLWLNGLLSIPITIVFFTIGTALYVFFKENPELLNVGMHNTDSIFPHFIMCRLPVGVAGLLIAAVFAAAMSTLSANINSTSTVLTEDFYRPLKQNATDRERMRFARFSGVVIGGLGVGLALLMATYNIASLWDQFNFFLGLFTSGLGGLFAMGIFSRRIGAKSAVTGFVGSFLTLLLFNAYSHISFILYGFIGLVSCYAIGYISSFVYGKGR